MRRILLIAVAAAALCGAGIEPSLALPLNGLQGNETVENGSQIDQVRLFCFNRYNGRFLHWGPCYAQPRYYHPRVYCRSNYSGRFLHWGAC